MGVSTLQRHGCLFQLRRSVYAPRPHPRSKWLPQPSLALGFWTSGLQHPPHWTCSSAGQTSPPGPPPPRPHGHWSGHAGRSWCGSRRPPASFSWWSFARRRRRGCASRSSGRRGWERGATWGGEKERQGAEAEAPGMQQTEGLQCPPSVPAEALKPNWPLCPSQARMAPKCSPQTPKLSKSELKPQ